MTWESQGPATPQDPHGVTQRRRFRSSGRKLLDISDESLDGSAVEGDLDKLGAAAAHYGRLPLVIDDQRGLTMAEIAETLSIPSGTVASRKVIRAWNLSLSSSMTLSALRKRYFLPNIAVTEQKVQSNGQPQLVMMGVLVIRS